MAYNKTPEWLKMQETYGFTDNAIDRGKVPDRVKNWLERNKEGVYSERNVAQAYYETGGKAKEEEVAEVERDKTALVKKAGNAIADAGTVKLSGDVRSKAMSQRIEIKKALEKFTEGDANNKFKYIDMSELTEKQYEIFKYIKQGVDVEELRRLLKYS